jgi:hypothetical protein
MQVPGPRLRILFTGFSFAPVWSISKELTAPLFCPSNSSISLAAYRNRACGSTVMKLGLSLSAASN